MLDLEYAGGEDLDGGTLGTLLRAEGRLTYHQLERFGNDLFTALDQLAVRGLRHRDLKPDNFAVFERADRSKQLMLLDFSLAEAAERDVTAGTRGYQAYLDEQRLRRGLTVEALQAWRPVPATRGRRPRATA